MRCSERDIDKIHSSIFSVDISTLFGPYISIHSGAVAKRREFTDVIASAFHKGEELEVDLLIIDINMKKASKKMADLVPDLVLSWFLLENNPNGHI